MPKILVIDKGSGKEQAYEFGPEGINFGRSEENGVQLESEGVSRRHATIKVSGNHCFLMDLGSGNGTALNGRKVKSNQQHILRNGDLISIDNFSISFSNLDEMLANSFNEITDSDILEVKLLKKVLKAIDKEKIPSLEVLNGGFVGKKFFVQDEETELVIGRDETCDFQIEEYVISRRHAKIKATPEGITLEDLNSKNGTFINNRRITKDTLHDGDRIAIGTIVLIFRNPKEIVVDSVNIRKKESAPPQFEPPAREEPPVELEGEPTNAGLLGEEADNIPEETPDYYPAPTPKSEKIRLSFIEMGLIGIGILIFAFAMISLVNLVMK